MRSRLGLLLLLATAACGGGDDSDDSATPDGPVIINGCPSLTAPQAEPGDPIDGDTWETYAMGFFEEWCTRCHASTLTGDDREGAPIGYDWDIEATVREHLDDIRNAVGVQNFMPFTPPDPTCDERQRLVRWIDADAP